MIIDSYRMTQNAAKTHQKAFEVKPGRARKAQTGSREKKAGLSFLRQMDRLSKSSRLSGSAARGRSVGRGAFVKNPMKAAQRVVVKARVVKSAPGAQNKALLKAHVDYITRDGVAEDVAKNPELYNEKGEVSRVELAAFVDETSKDRHHFRFIVSPENARNLDLSSYTNEIVGQMEKDLRTKLEYVACNHYNTDNPHAHLIIRAKDDSGKDLVIAKDYLSNGIRNRASEIATMRLGHRSELEIRAGITAETTKERFTQIDRDLVKVQEKSPDKTVDTRWKKSHERSFAAFKRSVQVQRLKELKRMELASEVSPGVWRLNEKMEATLKELGERGDIIKAMHQRLKKDAIQEHVVFDPRNAGQLNVTGVVVDKALSNELYDEKYMIVSATDNRAYYVPLSKYSEAPEFESRPGSIVTLSVKKAEGQIRKSDETIARIAAENGGVYSRDAHLKEASRKKLPEGVTAEAYVENHVKRLEALETRGVVAKVREAAWSVPADLTLKIQHTKGVGQNNFVQVRLESYQDLREQAKSLAPTWMDRELSAGRLSENPGIRSEFLRSLENAKTERLKTLHDAGLAEKTSDGIRLKDGHQEELYRLQMQKAVASFSRDHGAVTELKPGGSFTGTVRKIEHLPSGPHVVVGDGQRFVAVPYQKGMDRLKGQPIKLEMTNTAERKIRFCAVEFDKRKEVSRI